MGAREILHQVSFGFANVFIRSISFRRRHFVKELSKLERESNFFKGLEGTSSFYFEKHSNSFIRSISIFVHLQPGKVKVVGSVVLRAVCNIKPYVILTYVPFYVTL
jgi:hypothetical protein